MLFKRLIAFTLVLLAIGVLFIIGVHADEDEKGNNCVECHAEKSGRASTYMHPKVTDCLGCHLPHGSNAKKLLLGDEIVLCQEPCHTNMGRSHPFGRDLKNPQTGFRQDVTCTSQCHDPHGSEYKGILRMNARDLCFSCHDM